jgi:probable FeS assembly SUF system protein SufT
MRAMNHRLSADCPATAIPAGTPATLAAGEEVTVVQTLGGNVTVRADRGLFRITREDASRIEGLEVSAEGESAVGEFTEKAVWDAMRTCFDPEIPINIVDLGLIYDLSIEKGPSGGNAVEVKMTLTAPGCGMGPVIAEDARQKIAALPSVDAAKVHIVWDPIWNPRMISEAGRKTLGLE